MLTPEELDTVLDRFFLNNPTDSYLEAVLDRILHNTPADGDVETLRQWLKSRKGQQFAQEIIQPAPEPPAPSKYNINIGKITGGNVKVGDRTYNGTDAETLKNLVTEV